MFKILGTRTQGQGAGYSTRNNGYTRQQIATVRHLRSAEEDLEKELGTQQVSEFRYRVMKMEAAAELDGDSLQHVINASLRVTRRKGSNPIDNTGRNLNL